VGHRSRRLSTLAVRSPVLGTVLADSFANGDRQTMKTDRDQVRKALYS